MVQTGYITPTRRFSDTLNRLLAVCLVGCLTFGGLELQQIMIIDSKETTYTSRVSIVDARNSVH